MNRMLPRVLMALLVLGLLAAEGPAQQPRARSAPSAAPPAPPPEPPPPAFEPQLLRIADILGAATALSEACRDEVTAALPEGGAESWRQKMRDLMEAEAQTPAQRERLAGAFNQGYQGYGTSYRSCTASARLALERLLREGARLADEVLNRFGS